MIQLQQIKKSYPVAGEELVVLHDINLSIERGEFVAIMGPSGSGKSTLMNIIGCLDKPTDGEYRLNGQRISLYDEKELASVRNQSVGFVFQQFQLLPRLTALQNVELPMIYAGIGKKERIQKAEDALNKVGLADRQEHLPNELSGGQKQRVAIARSIVNEPDLILADEPTGALDSKTGVQIMDMFTLLNQEGTTVILVTHEAEVAAYADRTIFVRDGQVTTADEVVDQETYGRLIGSDTVVVEDGQDSANAERTSTDESDQSEAAISDTASTSVDTDTHGKEDILETDEKQETSSSREEDKA